MDLEAAIAFIVVWGLVVASVALLTKGLAGPTLLFATTTLLYTSFPALFYRDQAGRVQEYLIIAVLGSIGFWLGFTRCSLERDVTLAHSCMLPTQYRRLEHSGFLLIALSIFAILVMSPGTFVAITSYEGRIQVLGNEGPTAFLLNQLPMGAAVLTLLALKRRKFLTVLVLAVLQVAWAILTYAKLSLLTLFAAVYVWFVYLALRSSKVRLLLLVTFVLLPASLLPLLAFQVVRGEGPSIFLQPDRFLVLLQDQIRRLGDGGIHVGDFDGPFRVITFFLDRSETPLRWGQTYLEQLAVLLPRSFRTVQDLSEQFALQLLGSTYEPGLGFAFSPWAEALWNFGLPGAFIEGVLFGFTLRLLLFVLGSIVQEESLTLLFGVVVIVYFQRTHLLASLKVAVVYCLPYVVIVGGLRTIREVNWKRLLAE